MVSHPPSLVDVADARTCSSAARALPTGGELAPEMRALLSSVARDLRGGAAVPGPVRRDVLALALRILSRTNPRSRSRTGVPFSASIRLGRMG